MRYDGDSVYKHCRNRTKHKQVEISSRSFCKGHADCVAAGLSVRDMQIVFGFSTPQAIYKWFRGTAMPTIDNLVILAAMLDVTLDEIVVVDTITIRVG